MGLRKPVSVDPTAGGPVRTPGPAGSGRPESDRALKYFFVRGLPRSGTNWIGSILNLHPRICCSGEYHFEPIRQALDQVQAETWQIAGREPLRTVLDECFHDLVKRSIAAMAFRKPGADWLGDRTPRRLRPMLPDAPHFLILRDGRDVLVSWTFHLLAQKPEIAQSVAPEFARPWIAGASRKMASNRDYFRERPEELLSEESWVRYFAKEWWSVRVAYDLGVVRRMEAGEVGGRVHIVRYETLHAEPERERDAMYRFLALDPAEAAPISLESGTAPGFAREDPGAFFRHGAVGDWKRYFTAETKRWFRESAGGLLMELGYERDSNW